MGCLRPTQPGAYLVVIDASVWVGNVRQPDAQAVAIVGDRIIDVGAADHAGL